MSAVLSSRDRDDRPSVVTVGTYDGVHLGHRRLIDETIRSAKRHHCASVVVTFNSHPSAILRPDAPVLLLTSLAQKIALLQETGIDEIVVLEFDAARATERAEDFISEELVDHLHALEVVVGSNFRFGFERRGDVKMLNELGARFGFSTQSIELVLDDATHTVVSSTRIRECVGAGEMVEASRLLGRPHELYGELVEQDGLHRVLVAPMMMIPSPGIYRVELRRGDLQHVTAGEEESFVAHATVGPRGEEGTLITLDSVASDHFGDSKVGLFMAFPFDREANR